MRNVKCRLHRSRPSSVVNRERAAYTKPQTKGIPRPSWYGLLRLMGHSKILVRACQPNTCVSSRCSGIAGLATSRNHRSTSRDSVLPLTRFRSPSSQQPTRPGALPCAVGAGSCLAGGPGLAACRIASALRKLAASLEEPKNLSKNECVFTPHTGKVNKIIATRSPVFSIECSSSTGACPSLVQP